MLSTYLGYSAIMAGNVEKKSKAIHDLLELFQKLQEAYQNYWHHGDASLEKQKPLHCFVLLFPSSFACSQMQQYRCLDGDNRLQERMTLMSI